MQTNLKARDVTRLLLRVYKRYQEGQITDARAQREAYLLNSILKAIEVTDLEDRITALERR